MTQANQDPQKQPLQTERVKTITLVGTYQPRQCGIATFTQDLRNAVAGQIGEDGARVIAIDDIPNAYAYNDEVEFNLPQQSRRDYRLAAELLNVNQIDVALVQHEYGIFGGDDGKYVLEMMTRLRMPIITTLHTVLEKPSTGQRDVLCEIIEQSARVVVMSERARNMLVELYDAPADKVAIIPHGIHDQPFTDPHYYADRFDLQGKRVLLTFGLLGPGKGLETSIRALPRIVAENPNTVYLIVGATHPHVMRREGTRYRESLEKLATELGVREHVQFHERFVNLEELAAYLGAADVYVVPYPNEHQITSGTLAYAVGAGKAVVSTPFWHAQEILADGRGCMFPFNDSDKLAENVCYLLKNDEFRHSMRRRAYQHGRHMVWPKIGEMYVDLANQVLEERHNGLVRTGFVPIGVSALSSFEGEPSLDHLLRMTDDTGMLQHAIFSIPDRRHGYCIDDNARAYIAAIDHFNQREDPRSIALIDRYLAFIAHAFNESNSRFRNFMSFDRKWLEDAGSDDSHGRTMWALGHAVQNAPQEGQRFLSYKLFKSAISVVQTLESPRSWAFTVLGLKRFLSRISIDRAARAQLQNLAEKLMNWIESRNQSEWPWPEPALTYDNARIAQALIEAGEYLDNAEMLERGISTLQWLTEVQTQDGAQVSPIGNRGWMTRDGTRARFDQQPLEVSALIDACDAAYRYSREADWFDRAKQFYLWFLGSNDLALALRDPITGGCADGLHATGVNFNQGAESSLALFMSTLCIQRLYNESVEVSRPDPVGESPTTTDRRIESA